MTIDELRAKWMRRREEWRALGALVTGAAIADELLHDLEALGTTTDAQLLTPTAAAELTHYHPESIARLVRTGKLTNYGTKHRPLVRRADLPTKLAVTSSRRPVAKKPSTSPPSSVRSIATPHALARDAIAGRIGRS